MLPEKWEYSFTRYLSSKKSVDDRALNQGTLQALAHALSALQPAAPLRVLEIGAGIGTMIERFLERELLGVAEYTALDEQAENIAYARARLPGWAASHGFSVAMSMTGALRLQRGSQLVEIEFVEAELFEFIARWQGKRTWELLAANAFLDLVDIPKSLPKIFSLAKTGGLFYFTINFDGATLFEPALDPELDDQIERLYHRTMDERIINQAASGDSRAGRHLFAALQRAGATILSAGASDWVVFARAGSYPEDEAYFLHFIINTLDHALAGHPELDHERFSAWISERHAQIARGELVYIAHQLDFCGRLQPQEEPET
jgi:SAM-dependent methyltransferase